MKHEKTNNWKEERIQEKKRERKETKKEMK